MTAADRAELRAAAKEVARAVADCQRLAEQTRAARVAAERFVSRLAASSTDPGPAAQ